MSIFTEGWKAQENQRQYFERSKLFNRNSQSNKLHSSQTITSARRCVNILCTKFTHSYDLLLYIHFFYKRTLNTFFFMPISYNVMWLALKRTRTSPVLAYNKSQDIFKCDRHCITFSLGFTNLKQFSFNC